MTTAGWYASRPWTAEYDEAVLQPVDELPASPLDLFRATSARDGERIAIAYFDGELTYAELDRLVVAASVVTRGAGYPAARPHRRVGVDERSRA